MHPMKTSPRERETSKQGLNCTKAPVTASKISEQMKQSEDGPFYVMSMLCLTRLHLSSRPKTLPLQSRLTRKVLISAHSFSFTADKLKLAKCRLQSLSLWISAFLDRI